MNNEHRFHFNNLDFSMKPKSIQLVCVFLLISSVSFSQTNLKELNLVYLDNRPCKTEEFIGKIVFDRYLGY